MTDIEMFDFDPIAEWADHEKRVLDVFSYSGHDTREIAQALRNELYEDPQGYFRREEIARKKLIAELPQHLAKQLVD